MSGESVVSDAFRARQYTDKGGRDWRKGIDGWFYDDYDDNCRWLISHEEMAANIRDESPPGVERADDGRGRE